MQKRVNKRERGEKRRDGGEREGKEGDEENMNIKKAKARKKKENK